MTVRNKSKLPKKIIFWGGTGQSKVNRPIVEHFGSKVVAIFDDTPGLRSPFPDVPIYCGWGAFLKWSKGRKLSEFGFSICIGNPHGRVRMGLSERLKKQGLLPTTLIHPSAYLDNSVLLGEGSQVMAGVVIQPQVKIGEQCIINTGSNVDHECVVEDGCEIAPGAVLCGDVHLGVNAWVGAGAVILPRISVGSDSIVGAGSVVTKDIPSKKTVVGIPAKPLRNKR